jgi:hypothetical protein
LVETSPLRLSYKFLIFFQARAIPGRRFGQPWPGQEASQHQGQNQAGANVIKLFTAAIYDFCYNLECLSLASLSGLV